MKLTKSVGRKTEKKASKEEMILNNIKDGETYDQIRRRALDHVIYRKQENCCMADYISLRRSYYCHARKTCVS